MPNASRRKERPPFNPNVLRWAREWRGRTVEETAKKLNNSPETIREWELGDSGPTVRQARQMADFYGRSFLEFFLEKPPALLESDLVPDFRLHKDAADPRMNRELKVIQAWAEEQRLNALDLYEILGEKPDPFPGELFAMVSDSPEWVAKAARGAIGFTTEDQFALPNDGRSLAKVIRRALEGIGVLVLKDSELSKYAVRGICIFAALLPVVVFGNEAPTAQAFTMSHELGHIILRQSAISGPSGAKDDGTPERRVERWCDQFAGAFLIPADAMNGVWAKPNTPVAAVGDDHLGRLASTFKVSRHSMLVRLVQLGYVEPDYYWKTRRPGFLKEESEYKSRGRATYYGSRYRSAVGDLYTGLVLEAWNSGEISNHNAAEFMGFRNLAHLVDIRDEFRP